MENHGMEAKKQKPLGRSALGRGLSALISTPVTAIAEPLPKTKVVELALDKNESSQGVAYISLALITNNAKQPRTEFKEEELKELSESIKTKGVILPLVLRPITETAHGARYEIVAGERRWRASQMAGLTEVPAIVRNLSDTEALEIAIIENVQRQNLSPIEEARAYQRLHDEFGLSQNDIAERVGKDRATVANFLRLLRLPAEVLEMVRVGDISMGHAKALLTIRDTTAQGSLARKTVKERLSVRDLEAIVSRVVVLDAGQRLAPREDGIAKVLTTMPQERDFTPEEPFPEVVTRLRNALGTKVMIRHKKSGRGRIEIEYFSEEELDRLVERIS
jgi:ParB family chromosome partitioning protein